MSLANKLSTLRAEQRPLYITVGTDIGGTSFSWPATDTDASASGTVENTTWEVSLSATGPTNAKKGETTLKASYQEDFDLAGLRGLLIAPLGNSIMEPEPPACSATGFSYIRDFEFWTTTPISASEMRNRIATPVPSMPHQEHSLGAGSKGPLCTEEQFLFGNSRTYGMDTSFPSLVGFQRLVQACNWSEGELAASPKIYYTRIVVAFGDMNSALAPIQFIDIPSRVSTLGITTIEPDSDISYLAQLQRSVQAPEGL